MLLFSLVVYCLLVGGRFVQLNLATSEASQHSLNVVYRVLLVVGFAWFSWSLVGLIVESYRSFRAGLKGESE